MKREKKDILSVKEFADEIGVHRNTVLKMINEHRISAFRITSQRKSRYRIARSEILRLSAVSLEQTIESEIEKRLSKKQ